MERYESIFQPIDDSVFTVDEARTGDYASESALRHADTTPAALRGAPVMTPVNQMIVDEDISRFGGTLESVFEDSLDNGAFLGQMFRNFLPTGHRVGGIASLRCAVTGT